MTELLFVKIPKLVFEPIALLGGFGILFSFFLYWKNKSAVWMIICFFLLFTIGSRVIAHNLIVSSRYSSVLLYPMTIAAVWFCFFCKDFLLNIQRVLPTKSRCLKNVATFVPYILFLCVIVLCLNKLSHVNPFDSSIVKICHTLSELTQGNKVAIYSDDEKRRIAYYTKNNLDSIHPIKVDKRRVNINDLRRRIDDQRNLFEEQYYVFHYSEKDLIPNQESLGVPLKDGKWQIIQKQYTSRKQDKVICLCRFTPGKPNIDIWNETNPAQHPDNLLKNGDFEIVQTGPELAGTITMLEQQKIPYQSDSNVLFPSFWHMRYYFEEGFDVSKMMQLSSHNPIEGKYSFCFDSTRTANPAVFWCTGVPVKKGDFSYSFYLRNDGDETTSLELNVRSYCPVSDSSPVLKRLFFQMPPHGLYRIHGDIPHSIVPSDGKTVYFSFRARGKASIDLLNVVFDGESDLTQDI